MTGHAAASRLLVRPGVIVVKMYYMNTNRDNFHDWARDKPDSTSFSGLQRSDFANPPTQPSVRWGRLAVLVVLAIVVAVGFKYFVRL